LTTRTRFTELVGCQAPLQLAAMPGVAGPELVAEIAEAGGVGMLGAALLPPDALVAQIDEVRSRTGGVIGVNFLMPFLDVACVEVAASKVRLVEFFYADPDPALVERVHAHGALVSWQVGSRAEALAAEAAGCDLVVAQGVEAGGHVRGTEPRQELLRDVVQRLQLPVLAAGGIGSAAQVAAALADGAAGVRVGTRFVVAEESNAHARYVEALLGAGADATVLTEAFSTLWPNAPHRVLRSCVEAATRLEADVAGETVVGHRRLPVPRFAVIPPSRETTGRVDAMALYAGESVEAITRVEPARAIVAELLSQL
jgi:nitronate monooxygenase